MPCNSDLTVNVDGPSGTPIPGIGTPFVIALPKEDFANGFPEDLNDLLERITMLLPPGTLQAPLNPNFGKDPFDSIIKLLDGFLPYLLSYKSNLAVLQMIVCILEVLCSLTNPFRLVRSLRKLFRVCIPAFLNLFPVFAMIVIILSLLLLLLELILYIIAKVIELIELILNNIKALEKAITDGDANSIKAITKKIAAILCQFQNFFVLLSVFNVIIDLIKSILALAFAIPACNDDNGSECCDAEVCPQFIKNGNYTRFSGTLQYLNAVNLGIELPIPLPSPFNLTLPARKNSIQFYDINQELFQQFSNIYNASDVSKSEEPPFNKPVYFSQTDTYTGSTDAKQVPYLVDLRLFYVPAQFGRIGPSRYIRARSCIIILTPTPVLNMYDNSTRIIPTGVITISGGYLTEDDGTTPLPAYDEDGTTQISGYATLDNFIHQDSRTELFSPDYSETDGVKFTNVEYTFRINHAVLVGKNIITARCDPSLSFDAVFINNVYGGNIAVKSAQLSKLVNKSPGFPNVGGALDCLTLALNAFRNNISNAGAADFQTTVQLCLNQLQTDTESAINEVVGIGVDATKSDFSLDRNVQFVGQEIKVSVVLKENGGTSLSAKLPTSITSQISSQISASIDFGKISNFTYDGNAFVSTLSSDIAGSGSISINFNNQIFSSVDVPADLTIDPSISAKILNYQFITIPVAGEGLPRRDDGDTSRD